MARQTFIRYLALVLAALALAGCAAQRAYREANDLAAHDQVEEALLKYREAVTADPGNAVYRIALLRARDTATVRLLEQAERDLAEGKSAQAQQAFQRVLAFDPANERARAGLRQVEANRRRGEMLQAAAEAFDKKDYEQARQKLERILAEDPRHEPALALLGQVNDKTRLPAGEAALAAAFRTPVSLEFRDAPLKQVFEVIARHSGLNFVFDKDVRPDMRTSIFLKNSTVEAAVYFLLMTNQLERQVMDANTILIYPNLAAKVKEYQELTVKTFYLDHAEAKNIANTFKTILKSRDVVVDEKLNLVILRDSPEAIKLASRLVALQDVAEPEVMLDVEVLEVQRSRITELGVMWPQSLAFAPLVTLEGKAISIDQLRGLNSRTIGVTGVDAVINARKTDGDSNTLANPRIRVRNKEKAKVTIGDRVPSFTTTVSSGIGGFASESINYQDVGLKLDVEPTIHLDNEVAIKISLEVSNLIDTVTSKSGTLAYRIGNRSASTLLQLKDGENQVLAGLIKNEDRSSGTKVPGLGNLPVVGRLFGSTNDTNDKTEIVLSITPHVVRSVQRPSVDAAEFSAGTEASFRRRPDTSARAPALAPAAAPGARPAGSAPAQVITMPPAPRGAPPVTMSAPVPLLAPSTLPPPQPAPTEDDTQ